MTNYGVMTLAAIMTQYDAYQSLSHGTTANSISRKLSANNKLYKEVEKSLFNLRGDSKKWSDLIELQSISDQLKLDKKTEIDLLEAVRAEADQYVQPDPERSQDYIVLSELLDDGYAGMALHMTHQSARTNQHRTAVARLANSSHNRLDARHDISTEALRIADQVVQSVTASDTCECGHSLDDHSSDWHTSKCSKCKCPFYLDISDFNSDGLSDPLPAPPSVDPSLGTRLADYTDGNCDHCGEPLNDPDSIHGSDEPLAEIYNDDMSSDVKSLIVHAEPCAEELMNQGYKIASKQSCPDGMTEEEYQKQKELIA